MDYCNDLEEVLGERRRFINIILVPYFVHPSFKTWTIFLEKIRRMAPEKEGYKVTSAAPHLE